jgi:hypothetical protein
MEMLTETAIRNMTSHALRSELTRSIEEAKREGVRVFDLGRSEWSQAGLITFKDRWGATRSGLRYSRLSDAAPSLSTVMPASNDWKERIAKRLLPHLPDSILSSAGALLYRHVG